MTKDTLIKLIRSVLDETGVTISASRMSKLSALGREYEGKNIETAQAEGIINQLKSIFSDEYSIIDDRHVWSEIQKKLTRY
jgi:hypothetical protein